MPDLRTLIFRYFFPLRMQLQLQQCTMHMSALLVICYTKGYVLLGRCANLKKKFEHTEKYFFLCTIPMRSILGRVPFRAPPPYVIYRTRNIDDNNADNVNDEMKKSAKERERARSSVQDKI